MGIQGLRTYSPESVWIIPILPIRWHWLSALASVILALPSAVWETVST